MRPVTMMQAQFQAHSQSGEALGFDGCKGGFFSDRQQWALMASGKTEQGQIPQCVRAGTRISVCQKNLFDLDSFELVNLGSQNAAYSPRVIDGILYGGGQYGAYAGRSIQIPVLPGETVTVSATVVGANMIASFSEGDTRDGPFTSFSQFEIGKGQRLIQTITAARKFTGLAWWADDGTTFSCGLKDLQIEVGTLQTPYEPYLSVSTCTIPCDLWEGDRFWPTTGQVIRKEGAVEQYAPQSLQSPAGQVNVRQHAPALCAQLQATLLTRRKSMNNDKGSPAPGSP